MTEDVSLGRHGLDLPQHSRFEEDARERVFVGGEGWGRKEEGTIKLSGEEEEEAIAVLTSLVVRSRRVLQEEKERGSAI